MTTEKTLQEAYEDALDAIKTPKRRRFAEEYLKDLNATKAALRAGYSENTARAQGAQILATPEVAAAVAAGIAARSERTQITQDQVLEELAKIGFANMQDYMRVGVEGLPTLDFSDISRDQAAALTEVTVDEYTDGRGDDARDVRRVKFKLADKRAALVDIGKHLGMWPNKVEVSGAGGGPIQTEAVKTEPDDDTIDALKAVTSGGGE